MKRCVDLSVPNTERNQTKTDGARRNTLSVSTTVYLFCFQVHISAFGCGGVLISFVSGLFVDVPVCCLGMDSVGGVDRKSIYGGKTDSRTP